MRTTGMAATVTPNSAEFLDNTMMRSCIRKSDDRDRWRDWAANLHGNTSEKEEIEFEEADHDLVPLIHS